MIGLRDNDVHFAIRSASAKSKYVAEDRAAVGLYVERPEDLIDASDACGRFIEQLAALVEAMKATLPNKGGA